MADVKACVFDAYGTCFDVAAAAAHCKDGLGDNWEPLAEIWRTKQLNYTWLRSLMNEYKDFWQVTEDALDFALDTLAISDQSLRNKLLALYEELDAYAEVPDVLKDLKGQGITTAILSNGSEKMLASAVHGAGIADLLDDVISVNSLKVYKPHPSVYQLGVDELGVEKERICFMSSNAWDVAGAANFGFQVVWVNRFGQSVERLPGKPVHTISDLSELPPLLDV
jgi:2-haloacid dehalogenase